MESDGTNTAAKKTRKMWGSRIIWVLSVLMVIAVIGGLFVYWQYRKTLDKNPEAEQQRWTSELGSVMIMPTEKPMITTVLDKTKLNNKTLSEQAQNGDRLYIFSRAKRVVLYRPTLKKVVNILIIQTNPKTP